MLREKRRSKKLTLEQAAALIPRHLSVLSLWERGLAVDAELVLKYIETLEQYEPTRI
jgi:cytoskeletal protein RodZ